MLENPLIKQSAIALLGIAGSFIGAKVFYFILEKYIKNLTKKTKTDLDDKLLVALETPFLILVVLIGLYLSAFYIDVIDNIFLNKIYFVFGVFWVIFVLNRVTRILIEKSLFVHPQFANMPRLLVKAVNIFVYFIGLIIILKYFNIDITPLIATLGLGGIAIGFALQDTLSNFFAGIHIVSDKPINIGDFIELDNK